MQINHLWKLNSNTNTSGESMLALQGNYSTVTLTTIFKKLNILIILKSNEQNTSVKHDRMYSKLLCFE